MSKSFFVLEIFIHKVSIFGQNGKLEVQRSSNTYGTVHAMKNLIRYSESAENSLTQVSHQILPCSTSSGSHFYLFFIRNYNKNCVFGLYFKISRFNLFDIAHLECCYMVDVLNQSTTLSYFFTLFISNFKAKNIILVLYMSSMSVK